MSGEVLVVVGSGGMGRATARRVGSGGRVLLADLDENTLESAAAALRSDGHDVITRRADVSSRESVAELARTAAELGPVTKPAHTAVLSPAQSSAAVILRVNLLGTAPVLEEFELVVAAGGSAVVISSMAGNMGAALDRQQEEELATAPTGELLELPFTRPEEVTDPGRVYSLTKRANQLRVQRASVTRGERGRRVNSISPGVISTPMVREELDSEHLGTVRTMVEASAAGRLGTSEDIAAAAAFLLGPEATFVSGTDLLVDGGVVAAVRAGRLGAFGRG
ncbi:short-chain dehydrogenase [Actinopolyspora erythraea]|uniref:Short-chain dehydrogenase n=1 Tax=Actinopolyspora erythraea TaxID=414996 RepID=A0A099D8J0_9ACTN|nr:SDR family oxidoreductase [Actinopolyspora erythraea]ASU80027.1 short-chain dehydrogenase [Actinopolyspora erythraea]KGI82246.1 short-chain dehydrogenase [Actinopolyspora erythraea]